jgi:hypothetical protein
MDLANDMPQTRNCRKYLWNKKTHTKALKYERRLTKLSCYLRNVTHYMNGIIPFGYKYYLNMVAL